MADAEIIKTTARYQQAEEPLKQRPVIHIAPPLPNTVRASLEPAKLAGERENPFRPDGLIYRSADPIVDYYKQAQNQSRAQSPTESQLKFGASAQEPAKLKVERSRSCCRRLLYYCCCCYCWRCCAKREAQPKGEQDGRSYTLPDATKANEMARTSVETYRSAAEPAQVASQPGGKVAKTRPRPSSKRESRCAIV